MKLFIKKTIDRLSKTRKKLNDIILNFSGKSILDLQDLDEVIPYTTFYNVLDLDTISVSLTLFSNATLYYNLGKNNIIEESFALYNEFNQLISSSYYDINYSTGEIRMNNNYLPGDFVAKFNYYPIIQ